MIRGDADYLKSDGSLSEACKMANHADTRTTQLYDGHSDAASLNEYQKVGLSVSTDEANRRRAEYYDRPARITLEGDSVVPIIFPPRSRTSTANMNSRQSCHWTSII